MSIQSFLLDLDDFTFVKSIGEGGFGRVVLVKHKETEQLFAAKISLKEVISTKDQKSFFSEVEILIKASNPASLNLFGFNMRNFSNDPYPLIITNYLPNGSLENIIEAESRSIAPDEWDSTKKFINILGIALGMKYLHSQGIIHCDLKPGNILLDDNHYPHICDFSLSKIFDIDNNKTKATQSGTGTPIYMPPEVIQNGIISNEGDIFAYSFIFYQI
ncbi:hypothetical protein TRFO_37188 [Tritrichomonas foetus]|uniref:Protein kinase domain-containing protein n=1 Tax=Tritrichomonas foetus TaxID=1144522 RepID=A0A1J4JG35_9EUKA|nr:hypothetical protein TRFO_37188 [Tritrichomonas foetus]|eukprot:OHS96611.1 hypothetical protein TRFO_37188 [Tritrichomonas foetus]